ncbi:MAG: hypothetical protein AB9836_08290 [Aminipila sp.]
MTIKVRNVENLIQKDFNGNTAKFCRELNLGYTTVWRVLNGTSTGVKKFIPALIHYCKKSKRDISKYIEF